MQRAVSKDDHIAFLIITYREVSSTGASPRLQITDNANRENMCVSESERELALIDVLADQELLAKRRYLA